MNGGSHHEKFAGQTCRVPKRKYLQDSRIYSQDSCNSRPIQASILTYTDSASFWVSTGSTNQKTRLIMTPQVVSQPYQNCIEAYQDCAVSCEACAENYLNDQDVMMTVACIRLNHDCAKICCTAISFMARSSTHAADVCPLCGHICEACAR